MKFPEITNEENEICNREGCEIFANLRKKYSNDTNQDLDIILNSLCFALVRLFKLNSLQEDAEKCSELIKSIVYENLKSPKS
jgi:hypothetical protein